MSLARYLQPGVRVSLHSIRCRDLLQARTGPSAISCTLGWCSRCRPGSKYALHKCCHISFEARAAVVHGHMPAARVQLQARLGARLRLQQLVDLLR